MDSKGKVLVVDDEPHQRLIMSEDVKSLGYEVTMVENGQKALEQLRFGQYDVLITDMQMPGMDGIRLIENLMIYNPSVSAILVTAHGSIETAVEAMKKGAEDYVLKPVEFGALEVVLSRVFKKRALVGEVKKLASEVEALKRDLGIKYRLTSTVGKSAHVQKLMTEIEKFAKVKIPLLVLGEIGSGKSDVARMVHYNGPWASNNLVFFDCLAVPDELHENHLFGQEMTVEAGVKTQSRPRLVERAHQGTLVIENIHRLNRKCQPRLSRVLREEKTQRTGGSKFYPVYVRVIATSAQHEFDRAREQEEFRWDIHDLLLENKIEIMPLRYRMEDIPLLIAATAKRTGDALGKTIEKIDRPVIEKLQAYDFPGNDRELEAMVESAVIRCTGTLLKLEDFSFSHTS